MLLFNVVLPQASLSTVGYSRNSNLLVPQRELVSHLRMTKTKLPDAVPPKSTIGDTLLADPAPLKFTHAEIVPAASVLLKFAGKAT